MARAKVKLNHRGIENILQSTEMHRLVQDACEEVAENVEALNIGVGDRDNRPREVPLPVKVEVTTTDRAHGSVLLAHPSGAAVQAKHGALTKGASAAGLRVR